MNLFCTMLQLVGNTNKQGFISALFSVWSDLYNLDTMPVKSALTKMRLRISFEFFKDIFDDLIRSSESSRRSWKGCRIYASDGDNVRLPAGKDIIKNKFRGALLRNDKETHYPRMFTVHCVDVLSGITKEWVYSEKNDEIYLCHEIATRLEKESITLYDRMHFNKNLIKAHTASGSYFFVRCRTNSFEEIKTLRASKKRTLKFTVDAVEITLLKLKSPKSGEISIFATNLPKRFLKDERVKELYSMRWGVETSFRDLTDTLKMEQWHSKTLNGVLQEIYMSLWLINQTRIQTSEASPSHRFLEREYYISNVKLVAEYLVKKMPIFLKTKSRKILNDLAILLQVTMERRVRLSRSYPRKTKTESTRYKSLSTVKRRA
jgi:hypothetical protein